MKDLKFRVWDKVKQKMFQPQAITFDTQTQAPFAVSMPGRSWETAAKFEFMLWTGLSDANEKNVYKNDFVKISNTIYKVTWNQADARFELIEPGCTSNRNISDVGIGVIVGNTYQNSPPITVP